MKEKLNSLTWLLVAVSITIFFFNIFSYDPKNGYDGDAHYEYIKFVTMYLPENFKLPGIGDTYEFFSPPLAYIFPSLIGVLCRNIISSSDYVNDCYVYQDNFTQFFQLIMFIGLVFMYVKISNKLFPKDPRFRNTVLILLICLTPNYKAFMMFRGEPFVTLLIAVMVYFLIQLYQEEYKLNFLNSLLFGVLIGLIALSRQWGFLFFPTVVFFTFISRKKLSFKRLFGFFTISSIVGFIISGWFYLGLYNQYGSFAKFNLEPNNFSILDLIRIMYININIDELFTNPTKNSTLRGLFPVFYADLWGDYNMYFSYLDHKFTGRNLRFENYLGRVALISVYPTALILYGLVKLSIDFVSKKIDLISITQKVIFFNVITTWFFYCSWIVIYNFYNETISGVSPVYMLQLVNFFPLLGGLASMTIYKKYPSFYQINLIILSFIFLHNIGVIYLSN
tara:strand:- start:6127 stop:7476 length:1350 start_codon:yes stop_codon:yes gene_type:complete